MSAARKCVRLSKIGFRKQLVNDDGLGPEIPERADKLALAMGISAGEPLEEFENRRGTASCR